MIVCLAASFLSIAEPTQVAQVQKEPKEQIRVVPVTRTPESNTVNLALSAPRTGEMKVKNPVWIQFRLDGYALGAGSQFDRAKEVNVSKLGQAVHVIIDNNPYIAINEQPIDPFNEDGYYYDTSYKLEIPYSLKQGMHVIRMFPARSYGESLKGENTFQVGYFYLGSRDSGEERINLDQPYLTYNEPSDQIPLSEGRPVLLDFYISNCELSADGYRVVVTIDGNTKRTLTAWQPYYIYGLASGKHTIRLQLINSRGNQVKGPFNDVQRTIQVR